MPKVTTESDRLCPWLLPHRHAVTGNSPGAPGCLPCLRATLEGVVGDGRAAGGPPAHGTPLPASPHRSPCFCCSSTCPLGSSRWSTFWVPCCSFSWSSWRTTLPTLRSTSPLSGECTCLDYHLALGAPSKEGQAATLTHSLGGPRPRFFNPHHLKQASDCFFGDTEYHSHPPRNTAPSHVP